MDAKHWIIKYRNRNHINPGSRFLKMKLSAYLLVLKSGQLHKDLGRRVLNLKQENNVKKPVFRIRRFLGLTDPDPLVRGTNLDPDPSIINQK